MRGGGIETMKLESLEHEEVCLRLGNRLCLGVERATGPIIDSEQMGLFELSQATKAAIKSLGFELGSTFLQSRSKVVSQHQKAFRYIWRLAEQLYAASISSVIMSTVGNAILRGPQNAVFDMIIINEASNISEVQVIVIVSRFCRTLVRLIQIGNPAQLGPTISPRLSLRIKIVFPSFTKW